MDNINTAINNNCGTNDNNISSFVDTDNNTISIELQEKFIPKKEASVFLSYSYERLGFNKRAERVYNCGEFLEFSKIKSNFKLTNANFCRDRLCPMCNWRRSYKVFAQVSKIMDFIVNDYKFLFLTLTVPNCTSFDLINVIDMLQKAFNKYIRYKKISNVVKGYFKALEVTYNKNADTYHPHFHVILAVPRGYFTSVNYIKRDDWLALWQKATCDNNITQVDIRKCVSKKELKEGQYASKLLSSAIAEIAKYSVKSKDYIDYNDCDFTDKVVFTLSSALASRRLCSFGGIFDIVRKKLSLDDVENGDLLHIDDNLRDDVAEMIYRYQWSCGTYKMIEYERVVPDISVD